MRLATESEHDVDAVAIEGKEFARALSARRLRVRVLTILTTVVDEDLDLEGIAAAHGVISGLGCA